MRSNGMVSSFCNSRSDLLGEFVRDRVTPYRNQSCETQGFRDNQKGFTAKRQMCARSRPAGQKWLSLDMYGKLPYIQEKGVSPCQQHSAKRASKPALLPTCMKFSSVAVEGRSLTDFVVAAASAAARPGHCPDRSSSAEQESAQRFASLLCEPSVPTSRHGTSPRAHHEQLIGPI